MKIFYTILFLMSFTSSVTFAQPQDATTTTPPNLTPITRESISVLHYANNILQMQTSGLTCDNGTLSGSYHFFPRASTAISVNTTGHYFFTCRENYLSNDPYYVSLKDHKWAPCKNTNNLMQCSIQVQTPPIVNFIVRVPDNSMQTATDVTKPYFFNIFFSDAFFHMSTSYYPIRQPYVLKLNKQLYNNQNATGYFTFAYDDRATPDFPTNEVDVFWNIKGPTVNATPYLSSFWTSEKNEIDTALTQGRYGTYYCGSTNVNTVNDVFGFGLYLNPLFGKTCTITCTGPWDWKKNFDGIAVDSMYSFSQEVSCR